MTNEDYKLHTRACQNIFGRSQVTEVSVKLSNLLGGEDYYRNWFYQGSNNQISECIRNRLRILASPHWRTGLKILLARGEINDTEQLQKILDTCG